MTRPVPTPGSLRALGRKLDRRATSVNVVLQAMRQVESLHLQYQNGRPIWRLSSGPFVTSEAAAIVIASDVGVGDSLFPGHPGQTWRFAS
jgi:hypothetical protein